MTDEKLIEESFKAHEDAPTWQDDPVARDAAIRWHMRGFNDARAVFEKVHAPTDDERDEPTDENLWDFAEDLLDAWNIEDTNAPSLTEDFRDRFVARFRRSEVPEPSATGVDPAWDMGCASDRRPGCLRRRNVAASCGLAGDLPRRKSRDSEAVMKRVKVIHTPARHRGRDPKPPAWWRTFWLRTGTVVEYLGVRWELIVVGAADQSWRQWARASAEGEQS